MKRVIEVSGKTVEAAINEGLSQLGITMDEADIRVLNAGGLFKKAKVEISTGEDDPIATAPSAPKNDKPEKKFEPNKSENKAFEPKGDEGKNNPQQKRFEPKRAENSNNNNQQKKSEPNVAASQNNDEPQKKTFLKKDVAANNNTTKNVGANSGTKQFAQSNNNNSNKFDEKRRPKKPFVEKTSVSAPVTEEHIATVTEFLTKLLGHMHIEGAVEIKEDNGMRIVINTTDSAIIGYRGEVLDSIQYLTSLKINEKAGKEHILLSVDALGYREKRVETLKNLAQKTAEKCIKNNRRVSLEPMNSADRRIIHAALSENEQVITRSEGHEPTRRIVVLPKR